MRTMCVSINGPGDPDRWPFDLETGMLVASKVRNLLSKFGPAMLFGFGFFIVWLSIVWMYIYYNPALRLPYINKPIVCEFSDRRTDKSNAYRPLPTGGA